MKRAAKIIKGVLRGILIAVVGLIAFYNVYMLIARYAFKNNMPTFCGMAMAVVVSGSMEPEIGIQDVIITRAQDSYQVGDVITFLDVTRGDYVTHRIVRVEEDGFVTKGDANNSEDTAHVASEAVVGKVVAVWDDFGKVISFLQSPLGLFCVLACGIVLWLVTDLLTGAKKKKDEEDPKS